MTPFIRHSRSFIFALVTSTTALVACGGGDSIVAPPGGGGGGGGGGGQVAVGTVTLTPATPSVAVGSSVTLVAALADASGNALTGRVVTWQSSNSGIAVVSDAGVVTGKAGGIATITASSEGKSGTVTVIVTVPVASVTVSPTAATITYGDTMSIAASARDASGAALAGRLIVFSSSDTTVAFVTAAGFVSARGAGVATITATSEGKTATATITVTRAPVARIVVDPASISIKAGTTQTMTIALLDANGNRLYGRQIAIGINNVDVSIVQNGGQYTVTGNSAGTGTLKIDSETATTTVNVTVTP